MPLKIKLLKKILSKLEGFLDKSAEIAKPKYSKGIKGLKKAKDVTDEMRQMMDNLKKISITSIITGVIKLKLLKMIIKSLTKFVKANLPLSRLMESRGKHTVKSLN